MENSALELSPVFSFNNFALVMITVVLRGICFSVYFSITVLRSYLTSDIHPFSVFVSLNAFNEGNPLTARVTLLLFFKIIDMVEWDMPDWWSITITDFSPLCPLIFPGRHSLWPFTGNSHGFCTLRGHDKQNNLILNQAQKNIMQTRDKVNRWCVRLLLVQHYILFSSRLFLNK